MENKLNITCNEAIKKLKAIGTALTTNWNSTYEKHVPIFFDFNYPRVNEGGICMDDITELFPRIAINMRNFKGPKSEIITMAHKTAANPDAYCLDLRVRLSVGCKRRYYFFFLYLPVFSYLRL